MSEELLGAESAPAFHIDDLEDPDQHEHDAIRDLGVQISYCLSLLRSILKRVPKVTTGATLGEIAAESVESYRATVDKAYDLWHRFAAENLFPLSDGEVFLNPLIQKQSGKCQVDLALRILYAVSHHAFEVDAVKYRDCFRSELSGDAAIDDCLNDLESRVFSECEAAYKRLVESVRATPTVPVPSSPNQFITLAEAGKITGLGQSVITKAIKSGKLKGNGVSGRGRRVSLKDLLRWAQTVQRRKQIS